MTHNPLHSTIVTAQSRLRLRLCPSASESSVMPVNACARQVAVVVSERGRTVRASRMLVGFAVMAKPPGGDGLPSHPAAVSFVYELMFSK